MHRWNMRSHENKQPAHKHTAMIQWSCLLALNIHSMETDNRDQPRMKRSIQKNISICQTFSRGNLFFPIEDRVSLCDPTRTKLLVRTALGPPGLATTAQRNKDIVSSANEAKRVKFQISNFTQCEWS